jgi:hypothetical protein
MYTATVLFFLAICLYLSLHYKRNSAMNTFFWLLLWGTIGGLTADTIITCVEHNGKHGWKLECVQRGGTITKNVVDSKSYDTCIFDNIKPEAETYE